MYSNGHAWVGEDESKRFCHFMQDCWLTLSTFTLYSSRPWGWLTQLNRTTQSRRVDDAHDYARGRHDEGRTTKSCKMRKSVPLTTQNVIIRNWCHLRYLIHVTLTNLKPSRQNSELIVRRDAMKSVAKNEMRSKLSAHIPMPLKRRENSCEVEMLMSQLP